MSDRRQEAYALRLEAAELARSRNHPEHKANGEEQRYAGNRYFMSFTKGLPHNPDTGLLEDPNDFVEYRRAIDEGFIDPFSDRVTHGAESAKLNPNNFRQWEAPTAGVAFDLQGPDAQAVTMDPAPPLIGKDGEVNPELVLEMAEVYELAFLRDVPLNAFENDSEVSTKYKSKVEQSFKRLNELEYIQNLKGQTGRPRKVSSSGLLDAQTLFRGSSPGVEVGPYLSQFMLIGNTDLNGGGSVADGLITYGVLQIDQKVPIADEKKDFMTDRKTYVAIQNGINPEDDSSLKQQTYEAISADGRTAKRFIYTPRDLATYVHFDALYEAYLNACIILLGMKTPFDPGFNHLSGMGLAQDKSRLHAGGFALYGGPHILNLVTEVSTRALKAVRFQKFNNHMRLRPEALAARIELLRDPGAKDIPYALRRDIGKLKQALEANGTLNALGGSNYFLPMAFAEGSPMHPAYGAGHATVAGACVTILKAFFDTSAVLVGDIKSPSDSKFKRFDSTNDKDKQIAFRVDDKAPQKLKFFKPSKFLTLEGELNKLAANISIGRDMAGVHYFSDYYDSLRMGEEIAIGILEEQALTYSTDPFVLSLPTFDGDVVRIGRR